MPNKVISILQPGYLPYSGFFELMSRVDAFVIYDDVQYDKNSWRNRNRIRGKQGAIWLTIPVLVKGLPKQIISDVRINNQNDWRRKHLLSIRQCYSRAKYFDRYIDIFERACKEKWDELLKINMNFIYCFRDILGITTKIIFSSNLKSKGHKTNRIINICKELNADAYISTNGAKTYLDEKCFKEEGITLTYQDYTPIPYPQVYYGFVEFLSIVDMIFNCGAESRRILLSTS